MLLFNFTWLLCLMVLINCHTISKISDTDKESYDSFDGDLTGFGYNDLSGYKNYKYRRNDETKKVAALQKQKKKTMYVIDSPQDLATESLIETTTTKKGFWKRFKKKFKKKTTITKRRLPKNAKSAYSFTKPYRDLTMINYNSFEQSINEAQRRLETLNKDRDRRRKRKNKHTFNLKKKKREATKITNTEIPRIHKKTTVMTTSHLLKNNLSSLQSEDLVDKSLSEENLKTSLDKLTSTIGTLKHKYAPNTLLQLEVNTSKITTPSTTTTKETTVQDEIVGTADIETLLNSIKAKAIKLIAEQSASISDLIVNAVTETTFAVDPVINHIEINSPGYALSTFVSISTVNSGYRIEKGLTEPLNVTQHNIHARSLKDNVSTAAQKSEAALQSRLRKIYRKMKCKACNTAKDIKHAITKQFQNEIEKAKSKLKDANVSQENKLKPAIITKMTKPMSIPKTTSLQSKLTTSIPPALAIPKFNLSSIRPESKHDTSTLGSRDDENTTKFEDKIAKLSLSEKLMAKPYDSLKSANRRTLIIRNLENVHISKMHSEIMPDSSINKATLQYKLKRMYGNVKNQKAYEAAKLKSMASTLKDMRAKLSTQLQNEIVEAKSKIKGFVMTRITKPMSTSKTEVNRSDFTTSIPTKLKMSTSVTSPAFIYNKRTVIPYKDNETTKVEDDYAMLSLYEEMLAKTHANNVMMLTTAISPLSIKRNSENIRLSKRNPETLTDLNLKETIQKLYYDTEKIPEFEIAQSEANSTPESSSQETDDTSYEELSNKIAFNDYVNGFKHYLNFQRQQNDDNEKFSSQIRYQAHKHHDVNDIGKFILDKLPIIDLSAIPRKKRKFNDESYEDPDVTTRSDESWFKKFFFIYFDTAPTKKFHSSQTVSLKSPTNQDKLKVPPTKFHSSQIASLKSPTNQDKLKVPPTKFHSSQTVSLKTTTNQDILKVQKMKNSSVNAISNIIKLQLEVSTLNSDINEESINLDELSNYLNTSPHSFSYGISELTTLQSKSALESQKLAKYFDPQSFISIFLGDARRTSYLTNTDIENNNKEKTNTVPLVDTKRGKRYLFNQHNNYKQENNNHIRQSYQSEKDLFSQPFDILDRAARNNINDTSTAVVNLKVPKKKKNSFFKKFHFRKRNNNGNEKTKHKRHVNRDSRFSPLNKIKNILKMHISSDSYTPMKSISDYDILNSEIDSFKPVKFMKPSSKEEMFGQVLNMTGDVETNKYENDNKLKAKVEFSSEPQRPVHTPVLKSAFSTSKFSYKDNNADELEEFITTTLIRRKITTKPEETEKQETQTISTYASDEAMKIFLHSTETPKYPFNDFGYDHSSSEHLTKQHHDHHTDFDNSDSNHPNSTYVFSLTLVPFEKKKRTQMTFEEIIKNNKNIAVKTHMSRIAKYPLHTSVQSKDSYVPVVEKPQIYEIVEDIQYISLHKENLPPLVKNNKHMFAKKNSGDNLIAKITTKLEPDHFNDLMILDGDVLNPSFNANKLKELGKKLESETRLRGLTTRNLHDELKSIQDFLKTSDFNHETKGSIDSAKNKSITQDQTFIRLLSDKAPYIFNEKKDLKKNGRTFVEKEKPNVPDEYFDSSVLAYDDNMNPWNDNLTTKNIFKSPVASLSMLKMYHKNNPRAPHITTNTRPVQYYNTPVPMEKKVFEQFLKENAMDLKLLTTPINELPVLTNKWSTKKFRYHSQLLSKDDDKLLKNLKQTEKTVQEKKPSGTDISKKNNNASITNAEYYENFKSANQRDYIPKREDNLKYYERSSLESLQKFPEKQRYTNKCKKHNFDTFNSEYDTGINNVENNNRLIENTSIHFDDVISSPVYNLNLDYDNTDAARESLKQSSSSLTEENTDLVPEKFYNNNDSTIKRKTILPDYHSNFLTKKKTTSNKKRTTTSYNKHKFARTESTEDILNFDEDSYVGFKNLDDDENKNPHNMKLPETGKISRHHHGHDIVFHKRKKKKHFVTGPTDSGGPSKKLHKRDTKQSFYTDSTTSSSSKVANTETVVQKSINLSDFARKLKIWAGSTFALKTKSIPKIITPAMEKTTNNDIIDNTESSATVIVSTITTDPLKDQTQRHHTIPNVGGSINEILQLKNLGVTKDSDGTEVKGATNVKHYEPVLFRKLRKSKILAKQRPSNLKNLWCANKHHHHYESKRSAESDKKEKRITLTPGLYLLVNDSSYHGSITNGLSSKISRVYKRTTPKILKFTAKDVEKIEVVVDLMKNTNDDDEKEDYDDDTNKNGNEESLQDDTNKYVVQEPHQNRRANTSVNPDENTNTISVHVHVPDVGRDSKRDVQPERLRKVFFAKMFTPVNMEYQIYSYSEPDTEKVRQRSHPKSLLNYMSPGLYLVVDDNYHGSIPKGFSLKPVSLMPRFPPRAATADPKTYVKESSTANAKNLAKVTLSKEFISALNKEIFGLYSNLTGHDINKKSAQVATTTGSVKSYTRIRRHINWANLKKFFGHDRVCNCKCEVNKTMCKACAASDAVISELIFEFDNLINYMKDHCTEIQTYFWMNPSGGKKLRDSIHRVDVALNDYFRRVKGKCEGRTCNNLSHIDKRKASSFDSNYIGYMDSLAHALDDLAYDLETALELNICFNDDLKLQGSQFLNTYHDCVHEKKIRPREISTKTNILNAYSLDKICVNIICNNPSSLESTTISPLPVIDDYLYTLYFDKLNNIPKNVRSSKKVNNFKRLFSRKKSHKNKGYTMFLPAINDISTPMLQYLHKREVNMESPLNTDAGGSFWHDYINKAANTWKLVLPEKAENERKNNQFLSDSKSNIENLLSSKFHIKDNAHDFIKKSATAISKNEEKLDTGKEKTMSQTETNNNFAFTYLKHRRTERSHKKKYAEGLKPNIEVKITTKKPTSKQNIAVKKISNKPTSKQNISIEKKPQKPTSKPEKEHVAKSDYTVTDQGKGFDIVIVPDPKKSDSIVSLPRPYSFQANQRTKAEIEISSTSEKDKRIVRMLKVEPVNELTTATTNNPTTIIIINDYDKLEDSNDFNLALESNEKKKKLAYISLLLSMLKHQANKLDVEWKTFITNLTSVNPDENFVENTNDFMKFESSTVPTNGIDFWENSYRSRSFDMDVDDMLHDIKTSTIDQYNFLEAQGLQTKQKSVIERIADKFHISVVPGRRKLFKLPESILDDEALEDFQKYYTSVGKSYTSVQTYHTSDAILDGTHQVSSTSHQPQLKLATVPSFTKSLITKNTITKPITESSTSHQPQLKLATVPSFTKSSITKNTITKPITESSTSHQPQLKLATVPSFTKSSITKNTITKPITESKNTSSSEFYMSLRTPRAKITAHINNKTSSKVTVKSNSAPVTAPTPGHTTLKPTSAYQGEVTRKMSTEACESTNILPDYLCDIRATLDHVYLLRKQMIDKDFELYVKNITCYKYNRNLEYFVLKTGRRFQNNFERIKMFGGDVKKAKSFMNWNWIRKKRSQQINNVIEHDVKDSRSDKRQNDPGEYIALKHSGYRDYFETFRKGKNGIYIIRKREKRKAPIDFGTGLEPTNLPDLSPRSQDEIYAMPGDTVMISCRPNQTVSDHSVTWLTDRPTLITRRNVEVNSDLIRVDNVNADNVGTYICMKGETIQRNVTLTLLTVPEFNVVFAPVYRVETCTYDDLKAVLSLRKQMSAVCFGDRNNIKVEQPLCLRDKKGSSSYIKLSIAMTTPQYPSIVCSHQCRRDIASSLTVLNARNSVILASLKVMISTEESNKTLMPVLKQNELVVTHTLRRKFSLHRPENRIGKASSTLKPGHFLVLMDCLPGYMLMESLKVCVVCQAGTFSKHGEPCIRCPAGSTSEPGSTRCRTSNGTLANCYWWWMPSCGYTAAALWLASLCAVCAVIALLICLVTKPRSTTTTNRNTIRNGGRRMPRPFVSRVQLAYPRNKTRRPLSPSKVILAKLLRRSPSSSPSRITADSHETKFELWKERNIPPPLPPIDFDLYS